MLLTRGVVGTNKPRMNPSLPSIGVRGQPVEPSKYQADATGSGRDKRGDGKETQELTEGRKKKSNTNQVWRRDSGMVKRRKIATRGFSGKTAKLVSRKLRGMKSTLTARRKEELRLGSSSLARERLDSDSDSAARYENGHDEWDVVYTLGCGLSAFNRHDLRLPRSREFRRDARRNKDTYRVHARLQFALQLGRRPRLENFNAKQTTHTADKIKSGASESPRRRRPSEGRDEGNNYAERKDGVNRFGGRKTDTIGIAAGEIDVRGERGNDSDIVALILHEKQTSAKNPEKQQKQLTLLGSKSGRNETMTVEKPQRPICQRRAAGTSTVKNFQLDRQHKVVRSNQGSGFALCLT
ncbi:hypothetical protein C8F04DRAFT_1200834 [Mycena alexandri]|uniref:Uncharacterized protein n=1 Tax=Mycena alexandri TaxID=1745969 RepID=A0AAD6S1L8_9AGAR|nr:hypothetical protein C8F04DRAFT_1200834 [Mycena alexandri]